MTDNPMTPPNAADKEGLEEAEERWNRFAILAQTYSYDLAKEQGIAMYLAGYRRRGEKDAERIRDLETELRHEKRQVKAKTELLHSAEARLERARDVVALIYRSYTHADPPNADYVLGKMAAFLEIK
jgi:hypothetical protein